MSQPTFEQLNDAELWRDWKRDRVAEIAANPALADSYESAGFGGLVIEALGYEAYRALGDDGRIEKNNDF